MLVARAGRICGRWTRTGRTKVTAFSLRLAGLAKPSLREYLHTLNQFTNRWVVDDSKSPIGVRRAGHAADAQHRFALLPTCLGQVLPRRSATC